MDVVREAQKVARKRQKGLGVRLKNIPRLVCTAVGAAVGAGLCYLVLI